MLSVCIITKNEEKNIERCLKPLKESGLEIIVADTGSTDKTKKIALQFTEHVYDFKWQEDFAAAKNFAISKASYNTVLLVDSDEYLIKPSQQEWKMLYKIISAHSDEVGRIYRINTYYQTEQAQENYEWLNRIFSKSDFHYKGRVHEQVVAFNGKDYQTYRTPLRFEHTGYDLSPQEKRKKAERNIHLLQLEWDQLIAEGKGDSIEQAPYILYQLGKSYYMLKDYQKACEYFDRGLTYDLDPHLEYVVDMVETYGYALINNNCSKEALLFENIYNEFKNHADFHFLMGHIYMNNQIYEKAVWEFQKATEYSECRVEGVNSYSAYYNIGVIQECLGKEKEAITSYKKCGKYMPARKRLEGLIGEKNLIKD